MALYEPAVDKGQPTHFDIVDGVTRTAKVSEVSHCQRNSKLTTYIDDVVHHYRGGFET
jgi:hypothetical protein